MINPSIVRINQLEDLVERLRAQNDNLIRRSEGEALWRNGMYQDLERERVRAAALDMLLVRMRNEAEQTANRMLEMEGSIEILQLIRADAEANERRLTAQKTKLENDLKVLKDEVAQHRARLGKEVTEQRRRDRLTPYGLLGKGIGRSKRVFDGVKALKSVAGDPEGDFYHKVIKQLDKDELFKARFNREEGFIVVKNARLSTYSIRNLKKHFEDHKMFDPFPPLNQLSEMEKSVGAKHLFTVQQKKSCTKGEDRVVTSVYMNDVRDYLTRRLEDLALAGRLTFDESTGDTIWLAVMGDKGGTETKLTLAIGNVAKPNRSTHLIPLGLYNGEESAEELVNHLGAVIDQLRQLKDIVYIEDGTEVRRNVMYFLGGDLKFLCSVLGHRGCSAKQPCIYCFFGSDGKTSVADYIRNFNCKLRTEADYAEQSAKAAGGSSVKPGSSFVFDFIDLANVIPPSLHIVMGVSQTFGFNVLIDWAKELDNTTKFQKEKTDGATLRKARAELSEKEEEEKVAKGDLRNLLRIKSAVDRCSQKKIRPSYVHDVCDAKDCLFRDSTMSDLTGAHSQRLICSGCTKQPNSFHAACCGLWTKFDLLTLSLPDEVFQCFACRSKSIGDVCAQVDGVVDKQKLYIEELKKEKESLSAAYESLAEALKGYGPKMRELVGLWKDLGADLTVRQANFCGNHCLRLLDADIVDIYLAIFPRTPKRDAIRQFLVCMGNLQRMCIPRPLTDSEIQEMDEIINEILTSLKKFAGAMYITPKLHILMEHVLPYVRKYRVWAKTSEQGLESVHAIVNRLKRFTQNTRDPREMYSRIFRHLLYGNYLSDRLD